jgi:hypothetical protein
MEVTICALEMGDIEFDVEPIYYNFAIYDHLVI